MAEGPNVGNAHVTVGPDLQNFQRELDAKLETVRADISALVTPEMRTFAADLRSKLDEVRESIKVKAELDPGRLREELRSLAAADSQDVKFRVTVEESTARAAELRVRSMLEQAYRENENYNNRVVNAAREAGRAEIAARATEINTRHMLDDAYREHAAFNARVVADSRRAGYDAGRGFFDNFKANLEGTKGGGLASLFSGALPGGRRATDPGFLAALGIGGGTPLLGGAAFPVVGGLTALLPGLLGTIAAAPAVVGALSDISGAAAALTKQTDAYNQAASLSAVAFGNGTGASTAFQAALTKTASSTTSAANAANSHQIAVNNLNLAEARLAALESGGGASASRLASAHNSVAAAQRRSESAALALNAAQAHLNEIYAKAHPTASQLSSAQDRLANAQLRVQAAAANLSQAQAKLSALQQGGAPSASALAAAQNAVANAQLRVNSASNTASAAQAKLAGANQGFSDSQAQIIDLLSQQDVTWGTLTADQRIAAIQLRENNSEYKNLSQSQKTGLNALLAEKAAWEALSPAQQSALGGYQKMTKAYNDLKDAGLPGALNLIGAAENAVVAAMGPLPPLINATTGAWKDVFDTLTRALDGPFYKTFIADMTGAAPAAIKGFASSIGDLAKGLGEMFDTFLKGGLGDAFLKWLTAAMKGFSDWAGSDQGRVSLLKFVATIERDWPPVLGVLKDFGKLISDLWRAFAENNEVLQAVELLLHFFAWVGGTQMGQSIIQLATFAVLLERVAAALRLTALAQALFSAINLNIAGFGATAAAPTAAQTAARTAALYAGSGALGSAASAELAATAEGQIARSTVIAAGEAQTVPIAVARLAAWVEEGAAEAAVIPTGTATLAAWVEEGAVEAAQVPRYVLQMATEAALAAGDMANLSAYITEAMATAQTIPPEVAAMQAAIAEATASAEAAAAEAAAAATIVAAEYTTVEEEAIAAGLAARTSAGSAGLAGGAGLAGAEGGIAGAAAVSAGTIAAGAVVIGGALLYFGNKVRKEADATAGVVANAGNRMTAATAVAGVQTTQAFRNLANTLSAVSASGEPLRTAAEQAAYNVAHGYRGHTQQEYKAANEELQKIMALGSTELGQAAALFVSQWKGNVKSMADAISASGKKLDEQVTAALTQAFSFIGGGASADAAKMATQITSNTKADYLALQAATKTYEDDLKNHRTANMAQDIQDLTTAQTQYMKDSTNHLISSSGVQLQALGRDLAAFMHDSAINPLSKATQADIVRLGKDVTATFDTTAAQWGSNFQAAINQGFSAATATARAQALAMTAAIRTATYGATAALAGSVGASLADLRAHFGVPVTPTTPGHASGGYISGAGTGTSDSIPAMLSNGEFVVNAKATAANLSTLFNMNRMAGGGLVGSTAVTETIISTGDVDQQKILQAFKDDENKATQDRIDNNLTQINNQSAAYIKDVVAATTVNMAAQHTNFVALQTDYRNSFNAKIASDMVAQRIGIGLVQADFKSNFATMTSAASADVQAGISAIGTAASIAAAGALTSAQSVITSSAKSLGGTFAFKATGGLMEGPGTGTSDSIPTMLSNGEFVVNANATAKTLPLLQHINGMAAGGLVGGVPAGYDIGAGGLLARLTDQGVAAIESAAIGNIVSSIKANTIALAGAGLGSMDPGAILQYATKIGTGHPYIWGGTGPVGYDCSGLTQAAYAHFNINIPRTSQQQYAAATHETRANALPGDLVFEYFNDPKDPTSPNHVGIFAGGNSMFDAVSPSSGIHYSPLQNIVGFGRFTRAASLIGGLAGAAGTIPTGSHLSIIDQALAAVGVPPPGTKAQWEAGMNTLIARESGWNPNSINRTDSNALAGHPSQGLTQTIPSTFADNVPASLRGRGILDPVANVAAAIHYIVSKYGNISNVQQANPNLPPLGYDSGGMWPSGRWGYNTSGQTEGVLTGAGVQRVGGAAGVAALNSGAGISRQVAVIHAHLNLDGNEIDERAFAVVEENNTWLVRMIEAGVGSGGG